MMGWIGNGLLLMVTGLVALHVWNQRLLLPWVREMREGQCRLAHDLAVDAAIILYNLRETPAILAKVKTLVDPSAREYLIGRYGEIEYTAYITRSIKRYL